MDSESNLIENLGKIDEKNSNEAPQMTNNMLTNEWQYYSHHPWCPLVYQSHYYPLISDPNEGQKAENMMDSYKMMPPIPSQLPQTVPYLPTYEQNFSFPSMYSLPIPHMSQEMNQISTIRRLPSQAVNKIPAYERKCEKRYSCSLCAENQCQIETSDEKEFRAHLDIHLGCGPPYVCLVCQKHFPFRSTLRNHMIAHMVVRYSDHNLVLNSTEAQSDPRISLYSCDLCPYKCREWSKLQRHQRMHFGIKPFKCPDCRYESYDKTKIRRHYVTHTREKPFCCEKCNSRFTQSGSLKSHLSKVHKITTVCFDCAYCHSYQTSNLGDLRVHIKAIHGDEALTNAIVQ